MPDIQVKEATREEVSYIAEHLRAADHAELIAAGYDDPAEAVRQSYDYTDWIRVAIVDGLPAVVWGVSHTDRHGIGSPWMLATDAILEIRSEFLAGCAAEVERMCAGYRYLFNQVHKDNAVSIRWLKRLGFVVEPEPTGPGGAFFNFWKEGACV